MYYKSFLTAIVLTIFIASCQQKTHTASTYKIDKSLTAAATPLEKDLHAKLHNPTSYVYQAQDGRLYHVYYQTDPQDQRVLIETPQAWFSLPQRETWAKGAVYEAEAIRWEVQGDQAQFKTEDQTLLLQQRSPLVKNYANDDQQIKITTTLENRQQYVLLERKDADNLKLALESKTPYKSTYSNDSAIWIEKDYKALLIINGVQNCFELKD
ncbi:hypothetical protein [Flavobacterium sp. JP2137]|uniref:hypothetical protein n=1 Tax=Flavobacterium sp. JP2137 TaxID=3414510 RepID=UPI003D2FDEDD